jgi:flavin-dependent dehydrogenase
LEQSVIIIGGGLAGLVSALHLSQRGLDVTLIEKNAYPRHKVCGEYISNEVLPYLQSLGFDPMSFGAKNITDFTLSTPGSRSVSTTLPMGGFSISRYCIDSELAKLAVAAGTRLIHTTVQQIDYLGDHFEVRSSKNEIFKADLVIGSFGKRSNLDIKMDRDFIKRPSPFLAVKAHYKGDFPEEAVGLHNFEGGYCGVSKVENDHINICYISDFKSFKKYKNIEDFQQQVVAKNKFLGAAFKNFELVFDKPLTISQVSFATKNPVENHILMCGDSAGMIHPLAGNGMGMAIRSAQMVSELILDYSHGRLPNRTALEVAYEKQWKNEFSARLNSGHIISKLFRLGIFSEMIMIFLKSFPFVLPFIIRKTHGKPMQAAK